MSGEEYIPGEKNIGEAEVKKRYLAGFIGFIFSLIYVLIVYFSEWQAWTTVFSFLPFFLGYIGIIQGRMSFCAMFAVQNVYSTGFEGGGKEKVESETNQEKDIKKAKQIHLYTIILSAISTALVYLAFEMFI